MSDDEDNEIERVRLLMFKAPAPTKPTQPRWNKQDEKKTPHKKGPP